MSAPTSGLLRVVKCKATFKLLDEHGYTVAETLLSGPEDQANAERLARCSNAHQGLVEALEAVVASYDGLDCSCLPATTEPDGLILPRALCLPCRAHAALAAARGEAL